MHCCRECPSEILENCAGAGLVAVYPRCTGVIVLPGIQALLARQIFRAWRG